MCTICAALAGGSRFLIKRYNGFYNLKSVSFIFWLSSLVRSLYILETKRAIFQYILAGLSHIFAGKMLKSGRDLPYLTGLYQKDSAQIHPIT